MHEEHSCAGGQCAVGMMHGWHHPMAHEACKCGGMCGHGEPMEKDEFHELLEKVKCAKESLLKDKIKQRLEAKIGKKLDHIADLAVEALLGKWEIKSKKHELKERVAEKMMTIWSEGKK